MSDEGEAVLAGLDRRGFIKRLVAGAAFAVPVIQSFDMAGASAATCNTPNTRTFLFSALPDPSTAGESVTLTAGVRFASGGGGPGVGSIEFFDGATSLGTAPVDSSTNNAVLMTTAIGVGERTLTAMYLGFAPDNCLPSTSSALGHTVLSAYPLRVGEPAPGQVEGQAAAEPRPLDDDEGQSPVPVAVAGTVGLTAAALAYRGIRPAPKDG